MALTPPRGVNYDFSRAKIRLAGQKWRRENILDDFCKVKIIARRAKLPQNKPLYTLFFGLQIFST